MYIPVSEDDSGWGGPDRRAVLSGFLFGCGVAASVYARETEISVSYRLRKGNPATM